MKLCAVINEWRPVQAKTYLTTKKVRLVGDDALAGIKGRRAINPNTVELSRVLLYSRDSRHGVTHLSTVFSQAVCRYRNQAEVIQSPTSLISDLFTPMCESSHPVNCCFSTRRRQPFFVCGMLRLNTSSPNRGEKSLIRIIMKDWHLDIISQE